MQALTVALAFSAAAGWITVALLVVGIRNLRAQLKAASKNDARDQKTGRYQPAQDIWRSL